MVRLLCIDLPISADLSALVQHLSALVNALIAHYVAHDLGHRGHYDHKMWTLWQASLGSASKMGTPETWCAKSLH